MLFISLFLCLFNVLWKLQEKKSCLHFYRVFMRCLNLRQDFLLFYFYKKKKKSGCLHHMSLQTFNIFFYNQRNFPII